MVGRIERDQVMQMTERDAQLVEVLPHPEYEAEHLPGAVNIPLRELEKKAPQELELDRAVIVYCNDYL